MRQQIVPQLRRLRLDETAPRVGPSPHGAKRSGGEGSGVGGLLPRLHPALPGLRLARRRCSAERRCSRIAARDSRATLESRSGLHRHSCDRRVRVARRRVQRRGGGHDKRNQRGRVQSSPGDEMRPLGRNPTQMPPELSLGDCHVAAKLARACNAGVRSARLTFACHVGPPPRPLPAAARGEGSRSVLRPLHAECRASHSAVLLA